MTAPAIVALVAVLVAASTSTATLVLLLVSRRQQRKAPPPPGCGCVVVDRYGDGTMEGDPTRCPMPAHHANGLRGPR